MADPRAGARRPALALALAAALLPLAALPSVTQARPAAKAGKKSPKGAGKCVPQKAQGFLIRGNYMRHGSVMQGALARTLRYRVEQYGRVEGVGTAEQNPHLASRFSTATTFFGLPLNVHEKMAPALGCVEEEITRTCSKHPYRAQAVSGFRDHNSYRGGEVTNHLFGLAIDIDPERNPCCHCVEPWPDNPACQGDKKTPYERMAMPKCWVDAFEKYGFYWLGRDVLQDTMHFEFLGRPDRIRR